MINQTKQQEMEFDFQDLKIIKTSTYIPGQKNGKWSDKEHLKYVVFIDFYKQKMRSKEKRRSNQFYKEMSDFIGTRNGLQCRSHHQKLQQKYIYTNKIIGAFKQKFDLEQYKQQLSKLKCIKANKKTLKSMLTQDSNSIEYRLQTQQVGVQTDIQGIRFEFMMLNPNFMAFPTVSSYIYESNRYCIPNNMYFPVQP